MKLSKAAIAGITLACIAIVAVCIILPIMLSRDTNDTNVQIIQVPQVTATPVTIPLELVSTTWVSRFVDTGMSLLIDLEFNNPVDESDVVSIPINNDVEGNEVHVELKSTSQEHDNVIRLELIQAGSQSQHGTVLIQLGPGIDITATNGSKISSTYTSEPSTHATVYQQDLLLDVRTVVADEDSKNSFLWGAIFSAPDYQVTMSNKGSHMHYNVLDGTFDSGGSFTNQTSIHITRPLLVMAGDNPDDSYFITSPGSAFFERFESHDRGVSFTRTNLMPSTESFPGIAQLPDGRVIIAFVATKTMLISSEKYGRGTWSQVGGTFSTGTVLRCSVTGLLDGGIAVAFTTSESPDIRVNVTHNMTNWESANGTIVFPAPYKSSQMDLVTDTNGDLLLFCVQQPLAISVFTGVVSGGGSPVFSGETVLDTHLEGTLMWLVVRCRGQPTIVYEESKQLFVVKRDLSGVWQNKQLISMSPHYILSLTGYSRGQDAYFMLRNPSAFEGGISSLHMARLS